MSGEFVFLPLGGAGEIGMNLNLYGLGPEKNRDWLMVDFGITFSNGTIPGADVVLPDPAFIERRRERLAGLVLTHAHEDHIGAIPYLWDRIRCPIYASPFTMSVLRRKLLESGLKDKIPLHEVPMKGRFSVGPFDLEMVTLTHSIPEPNGIALRTPQGTVFHTGDWKLDPNPVAGPATDEKVLADLGAEGVLAIVCDSTNVLSPGHSGSEADLLESLTDLIGECRGRVAVTCFATNVARLETVSKAARANGRNVALVGRSLWRIEAAARENGLLGDVPTFLGEHDASFLPRDKGLYIMTGSQGEPRAALSRVAAGDHPRVALEAGDTVIYSSRVIPGNELSISRVQNQLIRGGVEVLTSKDRLVHVSGHPARDEMITMYGHVKPRICIPVHGEHRHMAAHAELARECGVVHAIAVENGAMVRLSSDAPGIIDHAPVGRLIVEGNRVVPLDSELIKCRTRTVWNGSATVTVVINGAGELMADARISTTGLVDSSEDDILDEAEEIAEGAVEGARAGILKNDNALTEAIRLAVRRHFRRALDKNPVIRVHLMRI